MPQKPDLSKSIAHYMERGHSKEEAEAIAMAQYLDDCLIFETIDALPEVKKGFPVQVKPESFKTVK